VEISERGAVAVGRRAGGRLRSGMVCGIALVLLGSAVGPAVHGATVVAGPVVRPAHQEQVRAAASSVETSPLVRYGYSLVHDSSGWAPNKGAAVTLLFSADGVAFMYSADATECLGDQGSYSYHAGRLSIRFHTPDVNVSATFALSMAKTEVTMPFQVASAKTGTSLSTRECSLSSTRRGIMPRATRPWKRPPGSLMHTLRPGWQLARPAQPLFRGARRQGTADPGS